MFSRRTGTFSTNTITNNANINNSSFTKSTSFYSLVTLSILIYLYNRELMKYENNILNYKDSEFCIAYVRSKCIPEVAEHYKKLISEGKVDDLEKAMTEVQRLLK